MPLVLGDSMLCGRPMLYLALVMVFYYKCHQGAVLVQLPTVELCMRALASETDYR